MRESNVCWWFRLACIFGSLLQKQLDRLYPLPKVSLPFQTLLLYLMVQKWAEELCDPRGRVFGFFEKDQPNCLAKVGRILHEKQLPCLISWHSSLYARWNEAKSAQIGKLVWTGSSLADHLVGNLCGIQQRKVYKKSEILDHSYLLKVMQALSWKRSIKNRWYCSHAFYSQTLPFHQQQLSSNPSKTYYSHSWWHHQQLHTWVSTKYGQNWPWILHSALQLSMDSQWKSL